MKVIALLSHKGGAGKTTLAIHLAVEAEQRNVPTVLIDLDPQASATSWGDSRKADGPAVVSAQATRLASILEVAAQNGAKLAVIDTAPHSEQTALAAARAADLIVIPCRPAILDLRAVRTTVDLAKLAGKKAVAILNASPVRGSLTQEATQALEEYGLDVAPAGLGQRAAFMHALTLGQAAQEYEPKGKAAEEIRHVYKWTCKHVGL